MALTIRKTAMAAMMTSTIEPAAVAVPRKSMSAPSRRRLGSPPPPPGEPAEVAGRVCWLKGVLSGQVLDGAGNLGPDRLGQRGVAQLVERGLALGAGGVAQEALDE